MAKREGSNQKIVRLAVKRFSSMATPDAIERIVRFSIKKRNELENAKQREAGDDARDYMNTASFFVGLLSKRDLDLITQLKPREIRPQLRSGAYPFSQLEKETRERLLHLPVSWIRGGANLLLNR